MSLPIFENALESGYLENPNDYFRNLQQAAITGNFDCTSAKYTIKEQDAIGSSTYHDIEVWLDYIVGTTSSGVKQGIDFTQLMFENIEHETIQGLYYNFDNNYHICYFYNKYDGLEKAIAVRKCNNFMRIVDPNNGRIFSIPCVIDYDMTSPSQQVSSYIITPNNHAIVMVQGNEDTLRLFKLNTRYMFNGRPFKLLAYQNALNEDLSNQKPTLLYLDLYLDELHDKDDIENQLAYNGEYEYTINIDSENLELIKGSNGTFKATVVLNGTDVDRDVIWESSNPNAIVVNNDGNYAVIGNEGESSIIKVQLIDNSNIFDSIKVQISSIDILEPNILITPIFEKIRQYESIDFIVQCMYGTQLLTNLDSVQISLVENENVLSNQYVTLTYNQNIWTITANKISKDVQNLYVTVSNNQPNFQTTKQFSFNVVSMFG